MKLLGSALFFCACLLFAWECLRILGRRSAELKTLLTFLSLLEREITDFETPLPRIYALAQARGCYDGAFWETVTQEGLLAAFAQRRDRGTLSESTYQVLCELCEELGKSEREEQRRLCIRIRERIESQKRAYDADLPNRRRLYVTLCLCIGGMCLILLL